LGVTPPLAFGGRSAFVAAFGPDLASRWSARVDAPGDLRGLAVDARGVVLVTGAAEAPEGPFFTRFDPAGNVVVRKDLQLGGLTTSAAVTPSGAYVLRHQESGVRLVAVDAAGAIVGAARLTTGLTHELPASLDANSLVPDMAVDGSGGVVTPAMLGPAAEPGAPEVGLVRVAPNGAVLWTRGVRAGRRAQIAAVAGGFVLLSRDAVGLCKGGSAADAFAIVKVDAEANVAWTRCIAARTSDLHLAVGADGVAFVAGQFTGTLDVGDGAHLAPAGALGSFLFALGPDGGLRGHSVAFAPPGGFVAIEGLAVARDGAVVVAGVTGAGVGPGNLRMASVFVASLTL
jgi:hypothetical protein